MGWEEGERGKRNKRKRQPGRTGAGQRREMAAERTARRAGSSWLPLPLVSFPSFSLLPTPNRPRQSECSYKARHEANSFEPAEWSERLTPGQSGLPGAAAVGSVPALALSLILQRLYFLLLLLRLYLSLRTVCSLLPFLFFVLRWFVLAASSASFFPLFPPPPNPQSSVSVRT